VRRADAEVGADWETSGHDAVRKAGGRDNKGRRPENGAEWEAGEVLALRGTGSDGVSAGETRPG
jgi:hypothetical protein